MRLLVPVEILYRTGVLLRNRCYDAGILRKCASSIPVISIGNLVVGGTGKTPVASWLLTGLSGMGHRPALVTRGYGADEILFYQVRNPGVPVVVDTSKCKAVQRAARHGADVAVLDDGFQHRAARRDLDIVLLAAEQGTEGALLPRGRFREPLRALSRADAIVVTRKVATLNEARVTGRAASASAPQAVLGQIHLDADRWTPLEEYVSSDGPRPSPAGSCSRPPPGDLLAVSSIAEPDGFHEMVRSRATGVVECMVFPDHHAFRRTDVLRIVDRAGQSLIVTTEKDAVKLKMFFRELPKTYVLCLGVTWDFGQEAVSELIRQALEAC
jgi:tetraacyldisaccharide 4'-kinase